MSGALGAVPRILRSPELPDPDELDRLLPGFFFEAVRLLPELFLAVVRLLPELFEFFELDRLDDVD
jgi:hypothetical protein